MKKTTTTFGIGIIVILTIALGILKFSNLKSKSNDIANKYEHLNDAYNKLLEERDRLKLNIEKLDNQINEKNKQLDFYISEIQKNKISKVQTEEYKQKITQLITELDDLIAEKKILDFKFAKEKYQNINTKEENAILKHIVADLETENKSLKSKESIKNKPYIYSINIESFDEKRNSNLISTDKARKVDVIQACIKLENFSASGTSDIFFQILTPEFETLNSKEGYKSDLSTLSYTSKISASKLSVFKNYCFEAKIDDNTKLKKGKYILNIYDNTRLISRAFFTLR